MKKVILLLTLVFVALNANAFVGVCDSVPDENGHFNCPYIKSGSITWDDATKTLTLDNAVVEYYTEDVYDGVRPISITEDATIVVHGACQLLTNAFSALYIFSYEIKNITITGDGSLTTSSSWIDIFVNCTRLTIKDINLETVNGIANNGFGEWCALTFDHVQANIKGNVERFGEGISFKNCSITYPADAYIGQMDGYGYAIFCGDENIPEHIVISRGGNLPGDVNGDSEVSIADVNSLVNAILNDYSDSNFDVNGDHEVTIADINTLIELILNPSSEEPDHEYVDLGLPSGTLWATCNIGASKPEEYGDYFAWGETEPRETYSWNTYKWCNGSNNTITKYCTDSSFGMLDNKAELDPADDAAYVNWGPSWRMPTREQLIELGANCTWKRSQRNGVDGHLVTGPNGSSLFFPAAGYRYSSTLSGESTDGCVWSRTLSYGLPNSAYYLYFGTENVTMDDLFRYNGLTVRAVRVP